MKERDLSVNDISYVIGTHGHSDHISNINLFPEAIVVVGFDISKGDCFFDNELSEVNTITVINFLTYIIK